ncbi:MAG TPA: RNA polymerase sigma factor region1.1 domain-containing protein, partial [Alphaproteobacteria bacterium]
MATKAVNVAADGVEHGAEAAPDTPLIDSVEATLKKLIGRGKERGFVTYDELNSALSSDEVSSEQIEDAMTQLSELGISVVEHEEAEEPAPKVATAAAEDEAEEDEAKPEGAKSGGVDDEDLGRTDDPVRMYLREMGSVELLSREGEIAIAKRIEAGREKMIAAICESPLTFRAIIEWRKALVENKTLLRDIIDLDATYGGGPGPDKSARNGEDEDEDDSIARTAEDDSEDAEPAPGAPAEDPDGDEATVSLSAMEAELMPTVLENLDAIHATYAKLARLQTRKLASLQGEEDFSRASERRHDKIQDEIVALVKGVRLNNARIEQLVDQLYGYNKELMGLEGKLMRLAERAKIKREEFLVQYVGKELDPNW